MSDESDPRCPPGYLPFKGKSPTGSGQSHFLVAKDGFTGRIRSAENRNKQLEMLLVPFVVRQPAGIWQGLSRDGKQYAFCYVGVPDYRMIGGTDVQIPPQPGKVFAVYIRETRATDGQYVVEYWEHLDEDPVSKGYPENHLTRYGQRVWPPE